MTFPLCKSPENIDLRRIARLLIPHRVRITKMIVVGILLQICNLLSPVCLQIVIDRAYPHRQMGLFYVALTTSLVFQAAALLLKGTQAYIGQLVTVNLQSELAISLFGHVHSLEASFFRSSRPGEIANRFQTIRSAFSQLLNFFSVVSGSALYVIGAPVAMLLTDRRLTVIGLVPVPIIAYLCFERSRLGLADAKKSAELASAAQGFQTETFSAVTSIRGWGVEKEYVDRFTSISQQIVAQQLISNRRAQRYATGINLSRAIGWSLTMALGWHFILSNSLTLGEYLAFVAYLNLLYNPLNELIAPLSVIQEGLVALDRAFALLDHRTEQDAWLLRTPSSYSLPEAGSIDLINVEFSFISGQTVLSGANATFGLGELSIVVGESGSGKTTLLRALLGFETPQSGQILLCGNDIRNHTPRDLRKLMSAMWQDHHLLSGTLWDYLTCGISKPTQARVDELIDICQLTELVADLPDGYSTKLGHSGRMLSSGQMQKLAIVKTVLRDTPIILLDEPTANLDPESESSLLPRLFKELANKTVIVVTHRPKPLEYADAMFRCADGAISRIGDSATL